MFLAAEVSFQNVPATKFTYMKHNRKSGRF